MQSYRRPQQGCQMVYFQTKNTILDKFWSALDWKMLIYFMDVWNILRTFGIFYDHLVHFVFIWYIFPVFGIMYHENSGNPGPQLFYVLVIAGWCPCLHKTMIDIVSDKNPCFQHDPKDSDCDRGSN
jgi:hypothetical protein